MSNLATLRACALVSLVAMMAMAYLGRSEIVQMKWFIGFCIFAASHCIASTIERKG